MRYILLILLNLFISVNCLTQELAFDLMLWKIKDKPELGAQILPVNDSINNYYSYDHLNVRGLEYFEDDPIPFKQESEYKSDDVTINLIIRGDGKILYRSFSNENKITAFGELALDSNNYRIVEGYSEEADTIYHLYPSGKWTIFTDKYTYLEGEYINGQRSGVWLNKDQKMLDLTLYELTYLDNQIQKIDTINRLNEIEIKNNIYQYWNGSRNYIRSGEFSKLSLFISNNKKEEIIRPYAGQFYELDLSNKRNFVATRFASCRVSDYEYYAPQGKYQVLKEGNSFFLILKEVKYEIVYSNKNYLVINECN